MNSKTLLIIEDDRNMLNLYEEIAKPLFSKAILASSYQEAKNVLESSNKIDCILADYKLQDGTTLDLFKSISININGNQTPRILATPVVIITGYADKNMAIESLNLQVFYLLEKPSSPTEITEKLQKCISYLENREEFDTLTVQYKLSQTAINHLKSNFRISPREIEVVASVLHHHENEVIGKELNICTGTVKRHLSNIFNKMKISSKRELKDIVHKLNAP